MPLSVASAVENSFIKGLITEASGLNFPENACTETYNCVFNFDGTVERRPAFDFELDFTTKTINRTGGVVNTYLWRNVAGDGNTNVFVAQIGGTLYFWRLPSSGPLSTGAVAATVTLSSFMPAGAPVPDTVECQFTNGNGFLFVTHPTLESFYVAYNTATDAVTTTQIALTIRDLEGDTADPQSITDTSRLTADKSTVDHHHLYNIYNQGWTDVNLNTWDSARTDMPNNIDVMWTFKNASETFDTTLVDKIVRGNTPAPRGHYILNLYNQDRATVGGVTNATVLSLGYQRVSTCAFFSGRVFYAGVNYVGYNSRIYFTQIVEHADQYGFCYQKNDPTSESLFDLGPDDGGFISIPEAGTIMKLVAITGGLLIFAQQGVWFVSGSTGLGFAANDYNVTKIASVQTLSNNSFVDIGGYPAFWNGDGIYIVGPPTGGAIVPTIHPLTFTTIKSFYNDIPLACKAQARGSFNFTTGEVQWLYRSTAAPALEQQYEFDRALIYNAFTQAWYVWKISPSDVKVNGIFVYPSDSGSISVTQVIDALAENVVDASANPVVIYTSTALVHQPSFKYLVTYPNGSGSYLTTFADATSTQYLDWLTHTGTGIDYESYFITGYKIHGQGLRKYQPTWINFFSKTDTSGTTEYYVQGRWDYATSADTGRWSSKQLVKNTDTNYSHGIKRIKMRGHGKVFQMRVSSLTGKPFKLDGWASYETSETVP